MKVRLVKGPFGGKVLDHPAPGRNELIYRGPKRMTRKARYEYEIERRNTVRDYGYYGGPTGGPHVEARYKIAMRAHQAINGQIIMAPCYHPDGSIFYEYIKDSERPCR